MKTAIEFDMGVFCLSPEINSVGLIGPVHDTVYFVCSSVNSCVLYNNPSEIFSIIHNIPVSFYFSEFTG